MMIRIAVIMKKMLCMMLLFLANIFNEDDYASIKLSNHVFNGLPDAGMHRSAIFTSLHFGWNFGDFVPFQKHLNDEVGVGVFGIITATCVIIDDGFI